MSHTVQRRAKAVVRVAGQVLTLAVQAIGKDELDELEHPLDAVELLVSRIPAAALRVYKQQIREERRRPIPAAIKRAVLERDRHRCVVCKKTASLHLHHYKHVAQGGPNTTGNLVTLCANHHTAVHAGLVKIKAPKQVPVE